MAQIFRRTVIFVATVAYIYTFLAPNKNSADVWQYWIFWGLVCLTPLLVACLPVPWLGGKGAAALGMFVLALGFVAVGAAEYWAFKDDKWGEVRWLDAVQGIHFLLLPLFAYFGFAGSLGGTRLAKPNHWDSRKE